MSYYYVHRSGNGSGSSSPMPCCGGSGITCHCGGGKSDISGVSMGIWVGSDKSRFPLRRPIGEAGIGDFPVRPVKGDDGGGFGSDNSDWVHPPDNWGLCDIGRYGQRNIPEVNSSELGKFSYYFIGDWSKFTEEDERRYRTQVIESDGFEVDSFPNMLAFNAVSNLGPVEHLPKRTHDIVTGCAEFALAEYNAKNETDWEFSHVIIANARASCGLEYLITFGAVSSSSRKSQDFQAMVCHQAWMGRMKVTLVRHRKTN